MNNKQVQTLANSYRELFYQTGSPIFFVLSRTIERTKTPVLLPKQELLGEREEELTI